MRLHPKKKDLRLPKPAIVETVGRPQRQDHWELSEKKNDPIHDGVRRWREIIFLHPNLIFIHFDGKNGKNGKNGKKKMKKNGKIHIEFSDLRNLEESKLNNSLRVCVTFYFQYDYAVESVLTSFYECVGRNYVFSRNEPTQSRISPQRAINQSHQITCKYFTR